MATATQTQAPVADPYAGCGPDCVLIDGTCRCYHGETVAEPVPEWMLAIDPPF